MLSQKLSAKLIKNGSLKKELPELYKLKKYKELNSWHCEKSIFIHTIKTLEYLEKITKKLPANTKLYLKNKINKNTRLTLLIIASTLHDLGKKYVKPNTDGYFPGHEHKGYAVVKKINLNKLNISKNERKIILEIIKKHGFFHYLLENEKNNIKNEHKIFKKNNANIITEIYLLSLADTLSSNLYKSNNKQYTKRIKFYKKQLSIDLKTKNAQ